MQSTDSFGECFLERYSHLQDGERPGRSEKTHSLLPFASSCSMLLVQQPS